MFVLQERDNTTYMAGMRIDTIFGYAKHGHVVTIENDVVDTADNTTMQPGTYTAPPASYTYRNIDGEIVFFDQSDKLVKAVEDSHV